MGQAHRASNPIILSSFFGSYNIPLSVIFTTFKALDPTLVSQLKDTLPDPLFEKLNGSLSIDQDRLKFAEYKIRVLEERLRLVRIEKYGPGAAVGKTDTTLRRLTDRDVFINSPSLMNYTGK